MLPGSGLGKQITLCSSLEMMHSPEFHRGSPPPPERGPKTFKQFMLSQDDDPEPEEAQERYRRYLVEWHGGEIKAEFAQTRNDERWV